LQPVGVVAGLASGAVVVVAGSTVLVVVSLTSVVSVVLVVELLDVSVTSDDDELLEDVTSAPIDGRCAPNGVG
jgi:hypothetical protein